MHCYGFLLEEEKLKKSLNEGMSWETSESLLHSSISLQCNFCEQKLTLNLADRQNRNFNCINWCVFEPKISFNLKKNRLNVNCQVVVLTKQERKWLVLIILWISPWISNNTVKILLLFAMAFYFPKKQHLSQFVMQSN